MPYSPLVTIQAATAGATGTPSTTLNTPTNAGTSSSLTPQLKFTGVTSRGDQNISYEIQIATDAYFAAGANIASYSETNVDFFQEMDASGGYTKVGQAVIGDGRTIASAQFYLKKAGTISGNINAAIYASSGTYGTNAIPTGSALATSDNFNVSGLSTSAALATFTFSGLNQIALTAGTVYVLVLDCSGITQTLSNNVLTGLDSSSSTDPGNPSVFPGAWTNGTGDFAFYLTPTTGTSLVSDKFSASDVGFADITNGAHSDPFVSGEQIGYTVQSALTNSTVYYWRVRQIVPLNNVNYLAAWSSTFSFTASSGGSILTKTQPAIARIATNLTKTQTAVGRIAVSRTKTQTAIARIQNSFTKTQPAIARVAKNLTKTQSAVARIANTGVVKTQPAVARIAVNKAITQSATARIGQSGSKTQPAISRISNIVTKTQPSIARIAKTVTKTQTATARITNSGLVKTQSAIARIATNRAVTQLAVSRIATTRTKTQSAISRISTIRTLTQPAISRISAVRTLTQPATASITQSASGTTGYIKVWNGTSNVKKSVKVWNGSTWVIKPVKYWNGSTWVTTT